MKYFAFCKSDILLTKELSIPQGETAPFPCQPWQVVTKLSPPNPPRGETTSEGVSCEQKEISNSVCPANTDGAVISPQRGAGGVVVLRLDNPITDERFVMMPLRQSFDVLSAEDYQMAGKCAELLYFDQNSKFCGCCGAPMKWESDINKKCTGCGKQLWPPLQTAVIVRVTRTITQSDEGDVEEILLVHALNFRGDHYGLVAGFVETGETLEECVRRELQEEVGIEVENIRYFGSQPWPYPCGLMVGFTAQYKSGNLHLQRSEISKGGWFRRDNLPEIPGPVSIAGQLIRDWLVKK